MPPTDPLFSGSDDRCRPLTLLARGRAGGKEQSISSVSRRLLPLPNADSRLPLACHFSIHETPDTRIHCPEIEAEPPLTETNARHPNPLP